MKRIQKPVILGYKHEIATARLARRAAEPILAKINSALYRPRRVVRFSEFVERWKLSMLPEMKPSTQVSMSSTIRAHLVPKFGDLFLHELTPEMIQSYVADLRAKVSEKSVWNIVMTMRSIWKTALAWQYATERLFEHVKVRMTAVTDEPRCFSVEDVRRILRAAPEPYRTFYWIAAETGMRAGELCGLRWQDVDVSASMVTLRQSSWRGKITTPKTRTSRRRFAISAKLAERLADMYANRKLTTDLLFHAKTGNPWDQNLLVKRKLQPLLAHLGIARAGMHAFRHFNASQMDRLSTPSALARDRLGHSSLLVTNRYTHSVSDDDRAVAVHLSDSIVI